MFSKVLVLSACACVIGTFGKSHKKHEDEPQHVPDDVENYYHNGTDITPAPTNMPTPVPQGGSSSYQTTSRSGTSGGGGSSYATTSRSSTGGGGGSSNGTSSVHNGHCWDAYECFGNTITQTAYCYGYYGCLFATINTDTVYAFGYYSNSGSSTSASNAINAQGAYAFTYASGRSHRIDAYGYRSLAYGSFYPYNTLLYVNLYGLQSGYNSDYYCYDGDYCNIECGGAAGCEGVRFYCYSGATCYYNCNETYYNNYYCPTLYSGIGSLVYANLKKLDQGKSIKQHIMIGMEGLHENSILGMTNDEINDKKSENKLIKENLMKEDKLVGNAVENYNVVKDLKSKRGDDNNMINSAEEGWSKSGAMASIIVGIVVGVFCGVLLALFVLKQCVGFEQNHHYQKITDLPYDTSAYGSINRV